MKPWRTKDTIEDNPIGLSKEVTSKLLPQLDRHQASLFLLFDETDSEKPAASCGVPPGGRA